MFYVKSQVWKQNSVEQSLSILLVVLPGTNRTTLSSTFHSKLLRKTAFSTETWLYKSVFGNRTSEHYLSSIMFDYRIQSKSVHGLRTDRVWLNWSVRFRSGLPSMSTVMFQRSTSNNSTGNWPLLTPVRRQVQNAGHRSQVTGHRAQGTGRRSQVTGHRAQGTGHRAQKTQ